MAWSVRHLVGAATLTGGLALSSASNAISVTFNEQVPENALIKMTVDVSDCLPRCHESETPAPEQAFLNVGNLPFEFFNDGIFKFFPGQDLNFYAFLMEGKAIVSDVVRVELVTLVLGGGRLDNLLTVQLISDSESGLTSYGTGMEETRHRETGSPDRISIVQKGLGPDAEVFTLPSNLEITVLPDAEIPEPSSLPLFLIGALSFPALSFWRWRTYPYSKFGSQERSVAGNNVEAFANDLVGDLPRPAGEPLFHPAAPSSASNQSIALSDPHAVPNLAMLTGWSTVASHRDQRLP